jgi:hypothetical protein
MRHLQLAVTATGLAATFFLSTSRVGAQSTTTSSGSAFGMEAGAATIGGAVGAVLGLALVRPDGCGEDIACGLGRLATAGGLSVIGTVVGLKLGGRVAKTETSAAAGTVGAVVGLAAGIGLHHLITEEQSHKLGRAATIVVLTVPEGLLAALASRALVGLRAASR